MERAPGRLYILPRYSLAETIVLTILSNRLSGVLNEEVAEKILAYELLNEIKSRALIDNSVWEKFLQYVRLTFEKYFGEKLIVPKEIGRTYEVEKELFEYLYRNADKIVEDYSRKEKTTIRADIERYVYRILMLSCRAYFHERGDFR